MARIALISKYPPLEGGIAAKTYWLAEGLSERGHEVHVITDRADVDSIHTIQDLSSIPNRPGVSIHRPDKPTPWHIPNEHHRALSLLDVALETIREKSPEILMAGYLVPYGVVAFIASSITGIPYVLFHGTSDIEKFLRSGVWNNVWNNVFSDAKFVITDRVQSKTLRQWSNKSVVVSPYIPNPKSFHPRERPTRIRRRVALIGKANYFWRNKGWHHVLKVWRHIPKKIELLVVAQGMGLEDFRAYALSEVGKRITWRPFVPPWEMPALLSSVDAVFIFEKDLPFPSFSNLLLEALYCGTAIITDNDEVKSSYEDYGIDSGHTPDLMLVVPTEEPKEAANSIVRFLQGTFPKPQTLSSSIYSAFLTDIESLLCNR